MEFGLSPWIAQVGYAILIVTWGITEKQNNDKWHLQNNSQGQG